MKRKNILGNLFVLTVVAVMGNLYLRSRRGETWVYRDFMEPE